MATQLQVRRGTTSELQSFTGAEGEITVDTDKDTLVVHDGSTAGGHPLLRADQARGYTLTEHYIGDGTWTKSGKDGLKRILVEIWGGGGGGGRGNDNDYGGGGGASGGHGYIIIESGDLTTNVAITIGQGGAGAPNVAYAKGTKGGTSSFGSYIVATGGGGGNGGSNNDLSQIGGVVTGTAITTSGGKITAGAVDLGSFVARNGTSSPTDNWEFMEGGAGPGGGAGNTTLLDSSDGFGYCGGGGGGTLTTAAGGGAQGSIIIKEFYGEV